MTIETTVNNNKLTMLDYEFKIAREYKIYSFILMPIFAILYIQFTPQKPAMFMALKAFLKTSTRNNAIDSSGIDFAKNIFYRDGS
ncbi:hypothetical protein [Flavobacterium sp. 7A]|uniref:hypothetical protein n=1 Tax=Flavobacterium sp. 7A TaxID=2940571 RepID=UPI0022269327|nr:hypothetical protein [Flavobacterium sp. 7A]